MSAVTADNLWSGVFLAGSAFTAGAVNAVAGGGTLLTFPALLAILSPVNANATSTMALLPASLAAGLGYREELRRSRRRLIYLWPPSLLGGVVGSLLLIRLPEKVFAGLVPWLLIGASTLLLLQRPLVRWLISHPNRPPGRPMLAAVIVFQFLVGVYGGYFGAGIGILMLSSLVFAGVNDIHESNALKNILAATMNGVTAVIFAAAGVVVWKYAAWMAASATLGGYVGARIGRRVRPEWVRAFVVCVGFAVALYSWLRA